MRVGIIKGYTFVTFVAYRRRITPPLFNGEKAARKRLFDAPCRWAKRRLHTAVFATRLQLSLGVLTIRHERAFICLLSAKLGRIFIVEQPVMS